jgi:hypothetical protein
MLVDKNTLILKLVKMFYVLFRLMLINKAYKLKRVSFISISLNKT